MNYIPGFSNYLQSSVPAYANGGPVMGGAALTPEQREDRRIAANTLPRGTSIVGPTAGKKPLSFGTDNTFNVGEGQEVRVVDAGGNVIFSGSGVEGANRAVAVGQSLSNDLGKNANFKIQTGERTINPDGSVGATRYIDVARAAPSQTGLGFLADNVLPFAAAFIPGIGPIAGAALGSAVSSAAQGRGLKDALVRAAIAGGSAYAGGQVFGPATPAASAAPVDKIASAAIPTSAFDGILVNATRAVAPSLVGSTLGSTIGSGLSSVTGYKTPAEKFAQQQTPTTLQTPVIDYAGVEPIDVLAKRLASGSGSPFGAAFPIPVNAMLSGALNTTQPAQQNKTAEDIEAEKNPMVVTGRELETLTPNELMATFGSVGGLTAATAGDVGASTQQNKTAEDIEAAKNPITVTGSESLTPDEILLGLSGAGGLAAATAGGGAPTDPATAEKADAEAKNKLGLEEYLRLLALGIGAIGGKGGSGSQGTYGNGRLNPIFSAKLPTANIPGGVGAASNLGARPTGEQDWLTYGQRPELSFYDYVPKPTGMAEGGMFAAKHGGQSRRTEFAVNGAGTGRSDDIPAVLSDGEYVIDAETVALLGDGSSKAGAKKLDELRVKVRKHKGQKLAKGRFSANAKRPEAYLSGGRI